MPLTPGCILNNRYQIKELLGQGGFGAVYRAWDLHMCESCVVKENLNNAPEIAEQFEREAKILFRLKHSGLPSVFDYFNDTKQGLYLVMEFIDGQNVDEIITKQGPFSESEAIKIICQLCGVLEYLHEQNPPIIHRDIKPQNIIITSKGKAVLVDFGLAKSFYQNKKTTTGALGYSPYYSPPEQYKQLGTDVRSDMYSLGATSFTLLSGQIPSESFLRLNNNQSISNVNIELVKIIEKAMAFKPEDRYLSVREFHFAIDKVSLSSGKSCQTSQLLKGQYESSQTTKQLIPNYGLPDYIEQLKEFVRNEQKVQNSTKKEDWDKPLSVRVAEGLAIDQITILSFSENQAELLTKENLSKFREGDSLRLNRGNPENNFIKCELVEEQEGNHIIIKPTGGEIFHNLFPSDGWVLDFDQIDVHGLQLDALQEVKRNQNRNQNCFTYYQQFLKGIVKPIIESSGSSYAASIAHSLGLNQSQSEAFINAYTTKNYYLIQGPPGTGKTSVLAHLAKTFAEEGKNVLVTAATHRAINNALRSIGEKTGYEKIIKIGEQKDAIDLDYKGGNIVNYQNLSSSPFSNNSTGIIIGATCYAIRTSRLKQMPFDVALIDEASQVTIPIAIMCLLKAPKCILIGDHMQLGPVIVSKHNTEWVTKSIFETLFIKNPGTMLDTSYRMNEEINQFPSNKFYGGKLHTDPRRKTQKLNLKDFPTELAQVLDPDAPDIFIEVDHCNNEMRSPEEAKIIGRIIYQAINCGVSASEIAVVVPYRAQARQIRKEVRNQLKNIQLTYKDILVDTVERIQGQEREMVIISLTTSSLDYAAKNADFYFNPNRLNVAITRARTKRIIIGNPNIFNANPEGLKQKDWVKIFYELYSQCKKIHLG
jgi:DNA replication ATP-dependent helicase Dna2